MSLALARLVVSHGQSALAEEGSHRVSRFACRGFRTVHRPATASWAWNARALSLRKEEGDEL